MKTKLILTVATLLLTLNANATCQDDMKDIFGIGKVTSTHGGIVLPEVYQRRANGNWKCRSINPIINKGCW